MAEFPHLGGHCSVVECNQLDILPITCDACRKTVCRRHITYESHRCEHGHKKNITVPLCPLCGKPVPVGRNNDPNIKINEHIERDCQSDPADRHRRRQLRCQLATCRNVELVRMPCAKCGVHFCLGHRHAADHGCPGRRGVANPLLRNLQQQQAKPAAKADFPKPSAPPESAVLSTTNTIDEDEALARALQASLDEARQQPLSPEQLDYQLAMQLQQMEENGQGNDGGRRAQRQRQTAGGGSQGSNCNIQ